MKKISIISLAVVLLVLATAFYFTANRVQAAAETETPTPVLISEDPNAKHEIAQWWGKVNQHKDEGVWLTDPDGVSGANINKYDYCKKWYPSTVYAVYDDRELIIDWKNAGNLNSYEMESNTYECTDINITTDYEAQKKLFKNNQTVPVVVGGETLNVTLIASSRYEDFLVCGDTRFRGMVNGVLTQRYLCMGESETITVDNERIKVTLKKVIHGENQIWGVAEVNKQVPPEIPITTDDTDETPEAIEQPTTGVPTTETPSEPTISQPSTETPGSIIDHLHDLRGTDKAQKLYNRLKGKILLQVENKGEAYYVSPYQRAVHYLKDGGTAYQIMKETGIGISETDYNTLISNTDAAETLKQRIKGKILLRVEKHGEAYYVNPDSLEVTYLANGNAAYEVMSDQGLGISDTDLAEMINLE